MDRGEHTLIVTILLLLIIAVLSFVFKPSGGTPRVDRTYKYAAPILKWTKRGGVHCEGWSLENGQWFYRCDNDEYGVVNHGSLFTDLQSSP